MADKVIVSRDKLVDIADRIRNQGFTEAQMTLDEMGQEVSKIPIVDLVERSIQQFNNNRVSTVGSHAFYGCGNLEDVNVPEATDIADSAFYGCTSLKSVNAPKAQSVGDNAFNRSGAESHVLMVSAPNIETLGATTFTGSGLVEANFPKVVDVPADTFSGCADLRTAEFPLATAIGDSAFNGAGAESHALTVNAPNVETLGATVFEGSGLTEANFPKPTNIPENTFSGCVDLRTADISGATIVGGGAFRNCEKLSRVDLSSVTDIQAYAFQSAGSQVESLTLSDMPNIRWIEEGAFSNSGLTEIYLSSQDYTALGDRAFSHCVKLKYVEVVGTNNNSIRLPYGVFEQCTQLETVKCRYSNSFGEHAFYKCEKLEKIDLGYKHSTVYEGAFTDCHRLKTMIFRGQNPERITIDITKALSGCYFMLKEQNSEYNPDGEIGYFYVPRDLLDAYKASIAFKNHVDQIRVIEDYPEICNF